MKHKHSELIKAWADGAIIQYKHIDGDWGDCGSNLPVWNLNTEYRIKPEPKPDFYRRLGIDGDLNVFGGIQLELKTVEHWSCVLKLTFDGESGKLKSAEVIK